MACYLDEEVAPERLQSALDATLPRFPLFAVSLRRGFFWYYHEKLRGTPRVEEEGGYPCVMPDALDNDSFLFRVLYRHRRISVEFFHSLADGTGAMAFLKALVAEYLQQGGIAVPAGGGILDRREPPDPEEAEDAFRRYAGSAEGGSFRETQAWELSREALPLPYLRVTHGIVDSAALSALAKSRGVTITALLVALLQLSFDAVQRDDEGIPQRPVKVSIPVNMRKFHPSKTLRNFSLFTNAALPLSEYPPSLDEALAAVAAAMSHGLDPAVLDLMMSMNVGAELSPALKPVPLFLKRAALKAANSLVGENQFTASLSNIGLVELPAEMQKRITRFDFVIGRSRKANVNCGVVGYAGKVVITLSGSIAERDVEEGFFSRLRGLGIDVAVESSEGGEPGDDGPYPALTMPPPATQRLKAADRAVAALSLFLSAFLGFLNLLGPSSGPWSPYAIGAILGAWAIWRLPRAMPKPRFQYAVVLVEAVALGYLGLVAILGRGAAWYFGYLFPSVVLASATTLAGAALARKRPFKKSYVPLALNLILGVLCFPVAAIAGPSVDHVLPGIVFFLSASGLIAIAYLGRKWWKNELRRKLHL
jgi:hypothetical protein